MIESVGYMERERGGGGENKYRTVAKKYNYNVYICYYVTSVWIKFVCMCLCVYVALCACMCAMFVCVFMH